jgi:hypothetical protein
MLSHLHYEEWLQAVPIISFILVFGVFAGAIIRLGLMKPNQASRAAQLPLEAEDTAPANHHTTFPS